jgi:hypothetical protein
MAMLAHDHVKAVGTEIDGSNYLGSGNTFPVVSLGICAAGAYMKSPCEKFPG